MSAKALYDFNMDQAMAGCMSFQKDQLIQVIQKREDGWWYGQMETSQGWFPANYVTFIEEEVPTLSSFESMADSLSGTTFQRSTSTISMTSMTEKKKRRRTKMFSKAKVLTEYTPNAYDEDAIELKEGEFIIIFEQNPTGIWKGKNAEGKIGFFPARYVEIEDEEDDAEEDVDEGDGTDEVIIDSHKESEHTKHEEPERESEEEIPGGWKKVKGPDGASYYYHTKTYVRAWTIDDIALGPGEPLPDTIPTTKDILSQIQTREGRSASTDSPPRSPALGRADIKPPTPTTTVSPVQVLPTAAPVVFAKPDPNELAQREAEREKKRLEEQAKRDAEERMRLQMMLEETQKRLEEERRRAQLIAESEEEKRKAKEKAEKEAQVTLEKRKKELAEKEAEERKRQEQARSEEEQKKLREIQEKEAVERKKMEEKVRELEKKLEEERSRSLKLEEEERKQRELLEEQRKAKQRELEEQQRKIREQEEAEKRRIQEEKETLRRQFEEERRRIEEELLEKQRQQALAAEKEEKERMEAKLREMEEKMRKEEEEREKARKREQEAEEQRALRQKLLEAEQKLAEERKRVEEMEARRKVLDMERELEEERKRMEKLLADLDEPNEEQPRPSTAPLINQRRLSTFIDNLNLPTPPSTPPSLPPIPKNMSFLPSEPPKSPLPSVPSVPPPIAQPPSSAPPKNPLPPPPAFANIPPPISTLPKSGFGNKLEAELTLSNLSSKIDIIFGQVLQSGRQKNLNEFIDLMKVATMNIKELLSIAADTRPVPAPGVKERLTILMDNLSSSLRSLLMSARTLSSAIEHNQQTTALLIGLEKIASEVLIIKYDLIDLLTTHCSAFFGFRDPLREMHQEWANKINDHVESVTQAIKFLANVARGGMQYQYQDGAGQVLSQTSIMRNFLSEVMLKTNDFTFKQNINFSLTQLSDALTILVRSSNFASKTNSQDSVQEMVNSAVKIARITKECCTIIQSKVNG